MAPSSAADLCSPELPAAAFEVSQHGHKSTRGKSTSGATKVFCWAVNEVLLLHPGNAVSLARCPNPARWVGIPKKAAWLWFKGQLWALFCKWTPPPTTKPFCFLGRIKKVCYSLGDPCPRGTIPPEGHGLNISSRIPPSILYCTEMSCSGLVFIFLLPSQCWTQKPKCEMWRLLRVLCRLAEPVIWF